MPNASETPQPGNQDQGVSQKELDARARELARRVMGKPPEPQQWPKAPKSPRASDAKPRKLLPSDEAS